MFPVVLGIPLFSIFRFCCFLMRFRSRFGCCRRAVVLGRFDRTYSRTRTALGFSDHGRELFFDFAFYIGAFFLSDFVLAFFAEVLYIRPASHQYQIGHVQPFLGVMFCQQSVNVRQQAEHRLDPLIGQRFIPVLYFTEFRIGKEHLFERRKNVTFSVFFPFFHLRYRKHLLKVLCPYRFKAVRERTREFKQYPVFHIAVLQNIGQLMHYILYGFQPKRILPYIFP